MTSPISNIIVILLIAANPCLLWPLTKNDISESLSNLKQLLEEFEAKNITLTSRNRLDGKYNILLTRSTNDGQSIRLDEGRQKKKLEQFSQKNLGNNQHDVSNLEYLLWQQYQRENYRRPRPFTTALKSATILKNPVKMLPSQETAQIDPIYVVQNNKPSAADNFMANGERTTTEYPLDDNNNVVIDLLHDNQQPTAVTGSSTINSLELFQTNIFFSNPIFAAYLAGFSGFFKSFEVPYFDKDCSMLVKTLPIFLVNNFFGALIKIGKLQLTNSFMVPFIALSVINFIVSFLFLEEYCPPALR
ncbi:uncharacterized protein LOC124411430 [Diprion similis]|uniref:uncharacterized protein LOC124411430 n=1 Tax=Diprion similis TaxID=362088 RepID=UPI001EF7DA27|nr:uncharacterized protein LOC124411430 [Diprion similis]